MAIALIVPSKRVVHYPETINMSEESKHRRNSEPMTGYSEVGMRPAHPDRCDLRFRALDGARLTFHQPVNLADSSQTWSFLRYMCQRCA